jgi:hypothetical protein
MMTDDKNTRQRYEQQFMVLLQRCKELIEFNAPEKEHAYWRNPLLKIRRWVRSLTTPES